jgi:hypothetical protein
MFIIFSSLLFGFVGALCAKSYKIKLKNDKKLIVSYLLELFKFIKTGIKESKTTPAIINNKNDGTPIINSALLNKKLK